MAKNICSFCSGTGKSTNYAKQVDPITQKYGTILGDASQQDSLKRSSNVQPGAQQCVQMCIPTPAFPSKNDVPQKSTVIQVPCDPPTTCPQFVCEPCPPPPPTRIWLIKSSPIPPKSFCLPVGGSFDQGSSSSNGCRPFMVCFPCPLNIQEPKKEKKAEEIKPIGYISRNKDMDFIAGKFISGCTCGKKNGLNGNCPRISCQDNPGCLMNPPRCWPQFKEPDPPPPPPPDQKMICVPFQLVYYNDRR